WWIDDLTQQERQNRWSSIPFGLGVCAQVALPATLPGLWLIVACFGYLALSVTGLLFPAYENKVFTFSQPLLFGEIVFMLWVLIVGAREPRGSHNSAVGTTAR
ncbi:MAG TPA: hypothetical protein VG498_18160, partial [Terriglobales bacterium]|nr:hypothetical protein [Terriglobales bacterium]